MTAIESQECQSANVLYEGLQRKVFWHGGPMLDTLHKEGFLKKVPTFGSCNATNTSTTSST